MTQVNISRRTIAKGMAWTVPAVAVAAAAPATAASGLTIAAGTPTVGYVGEAYLPLGNSVSGGTGSYTWSVSGGSLPPNLTLDTTTGTISGTPAAIGSYPLTLTVTDSAGAKASQPITISVGMNRAELNAEIIRQVNARRAELGLTLFDAQGSSTLNDMATSWSGELAQAGSPLTHHSKQFLEANNLRNENLAVTCDSSIPADPTGIATRMVDPKSDNSWLSEPDSYTAYAKLDPSSPEAEAMFARSGHRISIENPANKIIGIGTAMTVNGNVCSGYPVNWYATLEFQN